MIQIVKTLDHNTERTANRVSLCSHVNLETTSIYFNCFWRDILAWMSVFAACLPLQQPHYSVKGMINSSVTRMINSSDISMIIRANEGAAHTKGGQ